MADLVHLVEKPGVLFTAGLKAPPVILKKIQTLTASEKPKASEMNSRTDVGLASLCVFATCVPAKAKKRNIKVPTNSPRKAIRCPRKA